MKKCANKKCKVTGLQPLTNFSRRPHTSDGVGSYCKTCEAKRYRIEYAKKKANNDLFKNMF